MTNEVEEKKEESSSECMSRYKHYWQWIWLDGVWTDQQRCTTCGEKRTVAHGQEPKR